VFYADLRHFELVENLDYDKVRIAERTCFRTVTS